MLQTGLHMGIAAWINDMRKFDHFLNCPAIPQALELVDLESIQSMQDIGKVAEFSQMTNYIPRQNQPIDNTKKLWRKHREILQNMNFASEPWDTNERAEYDTAYNTLYDKDSTGFPDLSEKHKWYNDMRSAYEDVRYSEANATEIDQAFSNWAALGFKVEIEDAFETVSRLTLRSSINQAQTEGSSLEEPDGYALNHYGSTYYAPVHFSPLSAVAKETWMEAELSFDDLEKSVIKSSYNNQWKGFRANRSGKVKFSYVMLECSRPWFSDSIYASDDWKLDDPSLVSSGNGSDGLVPAYVNIVYLVSVKELKITAKPKPKPRSKPRNRIGRTLAASVATRQKLEAPKPRVLGVKTKMIAKKGFGTSKSLNPDTRKSTSKAVLLAKAKSRLMLTTLPAVTYSVLQNGGILRKISRADIDNRIRVTNLRINNQRPNESENQNTESYPTYVVGFGCKKLPLSPVPNSNYEW